MHVKTFKPLYPNLLGIEDFDALISNIKEDFSIPSLLPFINQTEHPGFILYSIASNEQNGTGIICLTAIQDYINGMVLTHENTLEEKETRQYNLIKKRGAVIKPVLLTYPDHEWFDEYLDSLKSDSNKLFDYFFEDRSQKHTFWMISKQDDVNKIQTFFERDLLRVYIADGHHRFSTFAKYSNKQRSGIPPWILSVYFPFTALRIYAFNRIFQPDISFDQSHLIEKVKDYCFVEKTDHAIKPQFKYNFLIMNKKKVWSCVWKPSVLEKYKADELMLDVTLLNQIIFTQILGVTDIRTDARIQYIEGLKGWEGMTREIAKDKNYIGFYLYPISMEDFQIVADRDMVLPPKSTWFEPRIRNGLIIHEFSKDV